MKQCATQMCQVFSLLFSWSLRECFVPKLWKTSVTCPVPKNNRPASLNDYRPVALTPIVMKSFERLILKSILSYVSPRLDPFQFAYEPNRSTDDVTLTVLQNAYSHLEKPGSLVRILFVDFSSALNTIQSHLMAQKLLTYSVSSRLTLWITRFLVNRFHSVHF